MKITMPLYEGDGYIHPRKAFVPADPTGQDSTPADVAVIARRARGLRNQTLRAGARTFGRWLSRVFESSRRSEIESYLAKSTDHADLERRIKEIERNGGLKFS